MEAREATKLAGIFERSAMDFPELCRFDAYLLLFFTLTEAELLLGIVVVFVVDSFSSVVADGLVVTEDEDEDDSDVVDAIPLVVHVVVMLELLSFGTFFTTSSSVVSIVTFSGQSAVEPPLRADGDMVYVVYL